MTSWIKNIIAFLIALFSLALVYFFNGPVTSFINAIFTGQLTWLGYIFYAITYFVYALIIFIIPYMIITSEDEE